MKTLEILFVGLITFLGAGNDPRTVIVFDVSQGENHHGNYIQPHAAAIRVKSEDVDHVENWPSTVDKKGELIYPLDRRTLKIFGVEQAPALQVDRSHSCFVPHLTVECPELGKLKPMETLKAEAAANLLLDRGKLEAVCSEEGAVASRYRVERTGGELVMIVAERGNENPRRLWLKEGRDLKIEIRNEPTGTEAVMNHFIAYYKQIAAEDVACTNLPFTRLNETCGVCPTGGRIVSTVACSNSNFP